MNNEQSIKHIASQLFKDINEDHLDLAISYFKDEDDGVDIFMSLCYYILSKGHNSYGKEICLEYLKNYLSTCIQSRTAFSEPHLAKDIIIRVFGDLVCDDSYGLQYTYEKILSKSLDYCIPF